MGSTNRYRCVYHLTWINNNKLNNRTGDRNHMEVKRKVIAIIENKLGIHPEEATMGADIKKDLGADSLDKLEIVMECEKEFSITIDDEYVEKILTVGDLVEAVEDRKN